MHSEPANLEHAALLTEPANMKHAAVLTEGCCLSAALRLPEQWVWFWRGAHSMPLYSANCCLRTSKEPR